MDKAHSVIWVFALQVVSGNNDLVWVTCVPIEVVVKVFFSLLPVDF